MRKICTLLQISTLTSHLVRFSLIEGKQQKIMVRFIWKNCFYSFISNKQMTQMESLSLRACYVHSVVKGLRGNKLNVELNRNWTVK